MLQFCPCNLRAAGSNRLPMKPQFVTLKFIAVAAITFACFGTFPAFAAESTGDPVTIEKDRILIPGTNISESDQRAMNAILAQYDKSLYKLKGYVNGKADNKSASRRTRISRKSPAIPRTRISRKNPAIPRTRIYRTSLAPLPIRTW